MNKLSKIYENKSLFSLSKIAIKHVSNWGIWIGFLVICASIILKQLGLFSTIFHGNELSYNIALIAGMVVFLSAKITSFKDDLEDRIVKQETNISEKVDFIQNCLMAKLIQQENYIDHICTKIYSELLSFDQVIKDIESKLALQNVSHDIKINHIALDATYAWDHIFENLLNNDTNIRALKYNLLIMTDDALELGPNVDSEIGGWCGSVKESLSKIKRDVPRIENFFRLREKKLVFRCKKYSYVPFVHGIVISGTVNVCYMSMLRWGSDDASRLYWGKASYYKISSDTADPIFRDLVGIFNGFFSRHWQATEELQIDLQC